MERSENLANLSFKKLIVYGQDLPFFSTSEKIDEINSHCSEIKLSVREFLNLPENKTQKFDAIEFNNIKIDEFFAANYAWKLKDSIDLSFIGCSCINGIKWKDLFASTDVTNLKMNMCGLTNDEAIYIACNLYPWTLKSVTFENENIDKELVINAIIENSVISKNMIIFN